MIEPILTSPNIILTFLVAVSLGFFIGLERERKRVADNSIFAGVRTFPLIALFGAIVGALAQLSSPWVLIGSFVPVGMLVGLAYWRESKSGRLGGTTEFAVLVAFGLGALAGYGLWVAALAGAVLTTGVLSLRDELRSFAGAVSRADLFAVVQFAVVSAVILPLVPDQQFGPWGVWNPRSIWLLVVLISGLSFTGYIAAKLVGAGRGILLSGLLGGVASSTAVMLSFGERSKREPAAARIFAGGALAASAVTPPRLLILLLVLQPALLLPALLPLGAAFLVTALGTVVIFARNRRRDQAAVTVSNPFELRVALQFAVLFALVLLLVRASQEYLGAGGFYLVNFLAGITQLDAITLTLVGEVGDGLSPITAARGLSLALAANNLFKTVLALTIGGRGFVGAVSGTLLLAAAAAVAAAFLIPLPG